MVHRGHQWGEALKVQHLRRREEDVEMGKTCRGPIQSFGKAESRLASLRCAACLTRCFVFLSFCDILIYCVHVTACSLSGDATWGTLTNRDESLARWKSDMEIIWWHWDLSLQFVCSLPVSRWMWREFPSHTFLEVKCVPMWSMLIIIHNRTNIKRQKLPSMTKSTK